MSLFKRRSSSKDLSAKIGYDLNPKKYERGIPTSGASPSTSMAPVSNITAGGPTHQKQASSSSILSYRKTSAPSPHGMGSGGVDDISYGGTPLAAGPSPLSSFKQSLPPSGAAAAAAAAASAAAAAAAAGTGSISNGTSHSVSSRGLGHQGPALSDAPPRRKSASSASSSTSGSPSKQQVEPPAKSLVIGEGVLFEGTTEGCAAAVVGGKLRGTVKSRRLEVTRAGRMEGTAFAETAEIAGTFEGTLTVTKALKICSTGRFKGNVSFGSIIVENGGKLEGKVNFDGCRSPLPEDGDGSSSTNTDDPTPPTTTTTTTTPKTPAVTVTATPSVTTSAPSTITTTTPTSPGTVMPSVAATAAAFKKPVLTTPSVVPGSGHGRVKLLRVTGASPRSALRPVPIQSPE